MRRICGVLVHIAHDFNPRIPQGMRPQIAATQAKTMDDFNPRIPQGMRPSAYGLIIAIIYNFNPRIPQGMRQYDGSEDYKLNPFQSTHSAGNATIAVG